MAAITRRYARALADTIFDRKIDAQQAAAQLRAMITLVQESQPLREVWESPAVSSEQKLGVLDAIAKKMGAERVIRKRKHHITRHDSRHIAAGIPVDALLILFGPPQVFTFDFPRVRLLVIHPPVAQ